MSTHKMKQKVNDPEVPMRNKSESFIWFLSRKLWVLILVVVIASCEYEYIEPKVVDTGGPDSNVVVISYSAEIQPIFDANCTVCHPSSFPLDLGSANSWDQLLNSGPSAPYIDTITPVSSKIYLRLSSSTNPMPPSGNISQTDIDLVLNWIGQGGKNN